MAKIELSLDEIKLMSNIVERHMSNEYWRRSRSEHDLSFTDWKNKYYSEAVKLIDKLYNEARGCE